MITAMEARDLVEKSNENINRLLGIIEHGIKEEAKRGQRFVWLNASPYISSTPEFKPYSEFSPALTEVQRAVVGCLIAAGFRAELARRTYQVRIPNEGYDVAADPVVENKTEWDIKVSW